MMKWTKDFYSQTGQWWGPAESKVGERDHQRLETLERLAGKGKKRILELGSSYGNTAFVMAQAGHEVIGIEISNRIDFAHQYEGQIENGNLTFVKEDFYQASFDNPFDVICYWNGFGIGSDEDQRTLLRRMANHWLKPDGIVLMDVANPTCWIQWTGDEENLSARPDAGYHHNVSERIDYDPVRNRLIDTWWETETPDQKLT